MKRVKLVLEGPTEREFVLRVLEPYVGEKTGGRVLLVPSVLITSVASSTKRGGTGSDYALVKRNVTRALDEGGFHALSCMLDLYGFPTRNRPWTVTPRPTDPRRWAEAMEAAFEKDVGDYRFKAFFCLHEFEALLLTDPAKIGEQVAAIVPKLDELRAAISAAGSPEHVNDGRETAPSKRLEALSGGAYNKVLHGPAIAGAIGVDAMREKCKHFDRWVDWLTKL